MNDGMFLVVDGVDVRALCDEILDDRLVACDDGQVKRRVAFIVLVVEKTWLSG